MKNSQVGIAGDLQPDFLVAQAHDSADAQPRVDAFQPKVVDADLLAIECHPDGRCVAHGVVEQPQFQSIDRRVHLQAERKRRVASAFRRN